MLKNHNTSFITLTWKCASNMLWNNKRWRSVWRKTYRTNWMKITNSFWFFCSVYCSLFILLSEQASQASIFNKNIQNVSKTYITTLQIVSFFHLNFMRTLGIFFWQKISRITYNLHSHSSHMFKQFFEWKCHLNITYPLKRYVDKYYSLIGIERKFFTLTNDKCHCLIG